MLSTKNIKEQIEVLDTIDINSPTAYEEALVAFLRMNHLPFLILELGFPFSIFRTRTHTNDDFFSNVSEIGLAPNHVIRSFARCNKPLQSMFYASENRITSYSELIRSWANGKAIHDKIYATISKWEVNVPVNALVVTSPNPTHRISQYDKNHGPNLDHFINEYQDDAKDAMIMIYDYLFYRFRKDAFNDPLNYIITTAYCNLAFTKAKGSLDAVFYPSVPFGGQGVNLAFRSTFDFPNALKLTHVSRNVMEIESADPLPHFKEVEIKHANIIGDLLEW